MYALTVIKQTDDNRAVYSRQVLGEWYELEFYPAGKGADTVANIKYLQNDKVPNIEICGDDEAYITLLTGETVHIVCRGKVARRNERG